MSNAFESLAKIQADLNALGAASALMDWDQQTYMPAGGAEARAVQSSILSRMRHEIATSDAMERAIREAEEAAESEEELALVRIHRRSFDKATKLTPQFVEEKSRLTSEGHEVWVKARRGNDFGLFRPVLEKLVEMAREEAEQYGIDDHVYTTLLDLYEEGATKADCDRMFDAIRGPLVDLVAEIRDCGRQPDNGFLFGDWPIEPQRAFTERIAGAVGFDFDRGRQDTAPHPFCTGWSVGDIRLTTRFERYLGSAIFGTLHEAGHGMYEQGSPKNWDRTPLAGGVSLGIHESQSRTWENLVGRSRGFWTRFLPDLQQAFPSLASVGLDDFVRAVNRVEPSLIRVEADELTYNLHIMIRYELECDLLTGALAVADLPEAWNEKYRSYLGIVPESDSNGCLQDVHWSMGALGYFPTYSMGNLLSVQFWTTMTQEIGDPEAGFAEGRFEPVFEWLREKIYSVGSLKTPRDLVLSVTGRPMGAEDYLAHMSAKYRGLYGLA
ncbi:MAG: carboxypeptidase M32 [Fimbriimonadaceae bacterium]|nr:carboxypeptidase M32 [Fimbriimonadaceae bacterium]